MIVQHFNNLVEFENACGPILRSNVAVNQMLLGILETAVADPDWYSNGIRLAGVFDASKKCLGIMAQRLPYGILLSSMGAEEAVMLADASKAEWSGAQQVFGLAQPTSVFARQLIGREGDVIAKFGLWVLTEVSTCPKAPGRARVASKDDARILQEWMCAFNAEALPRDPQPDEQAGKRLAESSKCWIWEDEQGRPVCCASNGRRVAGYWSVGSVYTPPNDRGRGYATSLVEHMSRWALESSAMACTLFTDLANPTSNGIYPRIGYRQVGEFLKLGIM